MSTERLTVTDEAIDLAEPFLDVASRFAGELGTVLLYSGGEAGGRHLLAVDPWLTLQHGPPEARLTIDGQTMAAAADPFTALAEVLNRYQASVVTGPGPAAGLFGYLAYDLKDHLEHLPRTSLDRRQLPTLLLHAPRALLIHDHRSSRTRLRLVSRPDRRAEATRARILAKLARPAVAPAPFGARGAEPLPSIPRDAYLAAVAHIRELIAAGHVYQVNFTQRFEAPFAGAAFDLLRHLDHENPASFFAFVQGGDHQIVSTSPERFLRRDGDHVESRPIKGTRPRGRSEAEDAALRQELLASAKDDAELAMIVDLVRNDLGRVCRPGSIDVAAHRELETYRNVHHLVSTVTGSLEAGRTTVDLLRATFPAGSITGCPKIRAMEIIDELESDRRHVYCGSIGYLGFDDTADLSVAIRTAIIAGGVMSWGVGGGVVWDSDPAAEYEESLHKGRTLAEASGAQGEAELRVPRCWHNGRLVPRHEATVPVDDLGLRRGFGLFETLRADRGRAPLLADHLARFEASWRALMPSAPPDLTWPDVIDRVLAANGLDDRPALVRLVATRGTRDQAPWDHSVTVMAEPYTHRLVAFGVPYLSLATYPEPRQNPLAAHKTLSYIYYNRAGAWALERGAQEALILNPDGTVSEGHSSGLLLVRGPQVIRPESSAALPSVMARAVCRQLAAWGFAVVERPVRPDELATADLVLLTSAMMGAVPVGAVDGRPCRTDGDLWRRLNDAIIPGWDHELPA